MSSAMWAKSTKGLVSQRQAGGGSTNSSFGLFDTNIRLTNRTIAHSSVMNALSSQSAAGLGGSLYPNKTASPALCVSNPLLGAVPDRHDLESHLQRLQAEWGTVSAPQGPATMTMPDRPRPHIANSTPSLNTVTPNKSSRKTSNGRRPSLQQHHTAGSHVPPPPPTFPIAFNSTPNPLQFSGGQVSDPQIEAARVAANLDFHAMLAANNSYGDGIANPQTYHINQQLAHLGLQSATENDALILGDSDPLQMLAPQQSASSALWPNQMLGVPTGGNDNDPQQAEGLTMLHQMSTKSGMSHASGGAPGAHDSQGAAPAVMDSEVDGILDGLMGSVTFRDGLLPGLRQDSEQQQASEDAEGAPSGTKDSANGTSS